MKNNIKSAKDFLKSEGCNIDSPIIDYDKIAELLVKYASNCGKEVNTGGIVFDPKEFKKMRKSKGYTLRDVEILTGISNAYLSQLESGKIKKPSYKTINSLLDLYNNNGMIPPISGGVKL